MSLKRAMGFWDLVLFYIVTCFSLRWIATAAAAGPSSLLIWALTCLVFFVPLTYTVLALSARYPDEGGLYVWTKKAFGNFAGFITGWSYWSSNIPYFPSLLYFAAGSLLFAGGPGWQRLSNSSTYFIGFAMTGLAAGVVLNVIGLDVGKRFHNLGAFSAWIPVLLLLIMTPVVWWKFGSSTAINAVTLIPSTHLKDVVFWSTIAFAYAGVEGASIMAGEIGDARRNIPRAVILAGVIMTLLYIVATACILIAVPQDQVSGLQGFTQGITAVANRLQVPSVGRMAAVLVTINAVAGVAAWFAAAARLPFVAGVDKFLPAAFARVHPRWGTPYIALLVQAVIAAAFVFLGQAGTNVKGAYDVLVSMSVISYFIPYLLMFAALIKLEPRPLARFMGSMGFLATTISILLAMIPADDEPNKVLAVGKTVGLTVLMVGIGAAMYWHARRRNG